MKKLTITLDDKGVFDFSLKMYHHTSILKEMGKDEIIVNGKLLNNLLKVFAQGKM